MLAAWPVDVDSGFRRRSQTKMEPGIIGGVRAGLTYECLRLHLVAVMGYDTSSDCTSVRLHALQFYLQPVLLDFQIVSQQRRGLIHIDNQHIDVAVVVEVAKSTAPAAVSRRNTIAPLRFQFLKSAVSQISK